MKKKILAIGLAAAMSVTAVGVMAGCGSGDGVIKVTGSSSVAPLMEKLAEAYEAKNEGIDVQVTSTDSGSGITDARDGLNDFGMASRALKNTETGVVSKQIAIDGVAYMILGGIQGFAVRGTDLTDVTGAQLYDLYANGTAIGSIPSAISREDGSGTRDAFDSLIKNADGDELGEITKFSSVVSTSQGTGDVKTAVAGNTSTLGYISLGSLSSAEEQGCKALSIEYAAEDGSTTIVEPTVENVQNGTYGAARYFQLAIKKDMDTNSDAYQFIEWIKGYMGQSVVLYEGYVPVYYTFNEVEFVEPTPNA